MLALSTKYAIRALRCLADSPAELYVPVTEISKSSGVPGPYLSKILKLLARKKIIESRRGAKGGVRLPAQRDHLTFHQLCQVMNDPILQSRCILSKKGCNAQQHCAMHFAWSALRERITQFLQSSKVY
ncbi:MAG: Rrf2 family transcriptional regulator [Bdellovibrionota bacterium]|nr:MAG: Rrf2 family transcriptional regulator [Bdellovibrionota bacterium]